MKKRYRYITSGIVKATDKVSDYRLVGLNNAYGQYDFIRIEIPDDLKLEKWSCDCYSTTEDTRTIAEFNPTVVIRFNGVTKVDKELTEKFKKGEFEPHNTSDELRKHGYDCVLRLGYLNKEQRRWWSENHEKIWQVYEIPKRTDKVEFYSEEYITEHFEKYLNFIKEIINDNEEYKEAFKERTNTELMDIYGHVCLMHCCDTKLDISEGIKHFIQEELDDEVRFLKILNEAREKKKNDSNS